MFKKVTESLLNLIYPPKCIFCKQITENGSMFCGSCVTTLDYTVCPICKREYCNCKCKFSFESLVVPFNYAGKVRSKIIDLKTSPDKTIAGVFADSMAASYKGFIKNPKEKILVVPVPSNKQRQKERGFNQAEVLAQQFADRLGLNVAKDIIMRTENSEVQHGLAFGKRFENSAKSYLLKEIKDLDGYQIILIDDIATTGATLDACAKQLKKCGDVNIVAVCAAYTPAK